MHYCDSLEAIFVETLNQMIKNDDFEKLTYLYRY